MLKSELENKLKEAEENLATIKRGLKDICERAIEENCSEAVEYVSEVNEMLELGISKKGYINIDIQIPIEISHAYEKGEIGTHDIKLTILGKEIEVESLDELELT